jgi:S-layer protein
MASAYATVAQELYVAYFGRPADVIGLSNIEAALAAADKAGTATTAAGLYAEYATNPAIASIVNSFGTSHESQTLYGTNTLNFVTSVFESLFNRAPLQSGLLFWTNAITSGQVTMGGAALAILAGASTADQATVAAKVTVATEFTTAMEANTTAAATEINAYQGPVAAAAARSLLQGVTAANVATYATSGAVQASLSNIVILTTPVTNSQLTTGVDTLNLSGNNNHVTGTANGAGATFTAGDTIAAVAGSLGNTLTVADLGTGATWAATGLAGATVSNIQNLTLVSGEAVNANTAASIEGLTGLQAVSITDVGGTTATAATTTAVTVTDAATAANAESVTGGSTVTLTANNVTTGAITTSGAAGAVAITSTEASTATTNTVGLIHVTGGTTVSVTQNLTGALNNTITSGGVTVTGSTATTSATVWQTAAATASATKSGVADGAVLVVDAAYGADGAGTITSVSVTNAAGVTVQDNALATLTLAGKVGADVVTNDAAAAGTATLALDLNGATVTSLTDTNAEVGTLNIVTGGTAGSTITTLTDASLKTLAVSGTEQVTLGTAPASLTSVAVTGGAGVVMNLGAATTFTSSSTGTDVITIAAATTKTVTGNGTAGEELVWNAAAAPAGTTYLGTVSGFKTLGIGGTVASAASQVFDMSKITGFSGYDVQANAGTNTIQLANVASGSPLAIDGAFAGTLVYATADTTGPTDSVAVTLGAASNSAGFTVAALTLEDSSHFGIGTVNLASNAGTGQTNVITAFQDASLSTLNLTGTGNLTITGALATTATTLTINANATNGTTSSALTFTGGITDTSITTLTLTGTESLVLGTVTHGTSGITVSGAADNAAISLTLAGVTSSGHTDTITLGNGNDTVVDTASAGAVNITLGNGNDTVTVGNTATNTVVLGTGHSSVIEVGAGANLNVTFGAHSVTTATDNVTVTAASASTALTAAPDAVITGLNVKGVDTITIADAATAPIVVYTTTQVSGYGSHNPTTLLTAINGVFATTAANGGNLAQHAIAEFTFQNNTYFVEQAGALGSAFAAGDTVVELTGNQTFTTASNVTAGGVLHLVG